MSIFRSHARKALLAIGLLATFVVPVKAATILETASYTGIDNGEYIVQASRFLGTSFTITQTTNITAIGAQFGGFPGGTIFGAIVPLASLTALPAGSPSGLEAISLADVVFSVAGGTHDLLESLSVTLDPGTYGVIFGSGLFGADGFAGLGDGNTPNGSPTYFDYQEVVSNNWKSLDANGVRIVVEGNIVAAVPELSTWAMLLLGFAGVGFVGLRRRKGAAFSAA